jgi:hypothetical protein
VFADSSEPKSIDEIASYGVPVIGAQKGQGSINQGISYVQDQRVSYTKRSVNLAKEYHNYLWETDKDGAQLPKAQDFQNHLMDALRYGLETYYYSRGREAGIVTSRLVDKRVESFIVSPEGMSNLNFDIGESVKRSQEAEANDWLIR